MLADSDHLHWIARFGGAHRDPDGQRCWYEVFPGDGWWIHPESGEQLVVHIQPVRLADDADVDVDHVVGQAADRPAWPRRLLMRLGQLLGG